MPVGTFASAKIGKTRRGIRWGDCDHPTPNGFDTTAQSYMKVFFDVGRLCDHDIAIVSRTLFEKAQANGVAVQCNSDSGTRNYRQRKCQ